MQISWNQGRVKKLKKIVESWTAIRIILQVSNQKLKDKKGQQEAPNKKRKGKGIIWLSKGLRSKKQMPINYLEQSLPPKTIS